MTTKEVQCEVCGETYLVSSETGLPIQYHDHKDLKYWKQRAENMADKTLVLQEKLREKEDRINKLALKLAYYQTECICIVTKKKDSEHNEEYCLRHEVLAI